MWYLVTSFFGSDVEVLKHLFVVCLGLFLVWLFFSGKLALHRLGIPFGARVVSSDGSFLKGQEVIHSARYRLSGKPDDILKEKGFLIPVERKDSPRFYPSYKMQLAAYCLLIEDLYGVRPPYGYVILRKPEGGEEHIRIPYDDDLRGELLLTMRRMRRIIAKGDFSSGSKASYIQWPDGLDLFSVSELREMNMSWQELVELVWKEGDIKDMEELRCLLVEKGSQEDLKRFSFLVQ